MKTKILIFCFLLFLITGCNKEDHNSPRIYVYDFKSDTEGWFGDFADYPDEPDVEAFYELFFSHAALPSPLNTNEGALKQSGNNHSDDLFMFIKKEITGLEPARNYLLDLEIEFATNAASGSIGVGGAPGESVFIKAGGSTIEPQKVLDAEDQFFRMNIDIGNQANDGETVKVIGNFANGSDQFEYRLKVLKTSRSIKVQSDANGNIWLIVGTDSGFEATTTIYYNSVKVSIQ
jgi:hypothetical protein